MMLKLPKNAGICNLKTSILLSKLGVLPPTNYPCFAARGESEEAFKQTWGTFNNSGEFCRVGSIDFEQGWFFSPRLDQIRILLYNMILQGKKVKDLFVNTLTGGEFSYQCSYDLIHTSSLGDYKRSCISPIFSNSDETQAAADLLCWILRNVENK